MTELKWTLDNIIPQWILLKILPYDHVFDKLFNSDQEIRQHWHSTIFCVYYKNNFSLNPSQYTLFFKIVQSKGRCNIQVYN